MSALCLLLATVLSAASPASPAGPPATPPAAVSPPPLSARAALDQANQRLSQRDAAGALALLKPVLDADSFDQLPTKDQHDILYAAGAAESGVGDPALSMALLNRAIQLPDVNAQDWTAMLVLSERQRDGVEAALAVTALARKWPDTLNKLDSLVVPNVLQLLDADPEARDARFGLLSSLYEARWPKGHFADGDYLWRNLALMLLQDGHADRAAEVAKAIRSPEILVAVRSDLRFDAIVQGDPAAFDLQAAMDAAIADARARVAAEPNKLDEVKRLASALMEAGKDSEALSLINEALAKANGPKPPFTDTQTAINWAQNARSEVLANLGRYDEAIAAMRAGMEHKEHGRTNISQAVNLAYLLNRLERPQEALAIVAKAGPGSPYGDLAVAAARAESYSQLGDKEKLDEILSYARAHLKYGPGLVEQMLVKSDDLDGAAALYIQRLEDPDMREDALLSAQDWMADGQRTPRDKEIDRRYRAMIARPDVQAAIKAVGRVEKIPFRED
jgi:tetratricopeptide (TPR) repeat protein